MKPNNRSGLCTALLSTFAILYVAPATAQYHPISESRRAGVTATELFLLAEKAIANGDTIDASTIFRALANDPDIEIRTEARFRHGMMLESAKHHRDAAILFRAILDEKPQAQRVRLELARVLALMGDEGGARRELRQAEVGGLPPAVEQLVNQFLGALRSRKPLGGSIEFAMAPDSNINRATSAATLDTVIAPLTLDKDARRQSDIGMNIGLQGYGRFAAAPRLNILGRLSSRNAIYRKSEFNDLSGSASIGLEWLGRKDRLQPMLGRGYRWYGGNLYAVTDSVSLNWLHAADERTQVDADLSVGHANYKRNDLQDGTLVDASVSYERSLSRRSGISLTLFGERQAAHDPGYSTLSGGGSLLVWREIGAATLYASLSGRRLAADRRLFLFPDRRRDWYFRGSLGATFRQLAVKGFAPIVRAGYEYNRSTVGLYSYRRANIEFGLNRSF